MCYLNIGFAVTERGRGAPAQNGSAAGAFVDVHEFKCCRL
jgi:hypothetical protein